MRKTTALLAALSAALLFLMSCTKDSVSTVDPSSSEAACPLTVGIRGSAATRSTTISADDEVRVSTLQVLVFRPDGALDAYGTVSDASELTLSCTSGERTVYALVNAPTLSGVSTLRDFLATSTLLSDNSASAFQMVGSRTVTLPQAATVTIDVRRLVSRISLRKVTRAFVSPSLSAKSFTVDEVYVINVAGDNTFSLDAAPSVWYNKRAYGGEMAAFTHDAPAAPLADGSSYTTVHNFFAYPNPTDVDSSESTWSARHTRLVIKATLGTDTYYYPITLPALEPNRSYEIDNLTITRPGSDDPDVPVSFEDCTFDLNVVGWTAVPVCDNGSDDVTI